MFSSLFRKSKTLTEGSSPVNNYNPDTHNAIVNKDGEIVVMPKLRKIETFEEKLYRKFSEEPLVPIGALVTAYCLGSGIKSFMDKDLKKSQKMMRARVTSQFATIVIFLGYAGYRQFDFGMFSRDSSKSNSNDQ